MNYRFLKISRYYKHYIDHFREQNDIVDMNYDNMLNAYLSDHYIYGDAFSHYLRQMGNDTYEIIFNEDVLQDKWADQHGIEKGNLKNILTEQIREISPDIIFWDGMEDYQFVHFIKDRFPSIKLHFTQIGVPIATMRRFSPYDFVLTCLKPQVKELKNNGISAYFFKHGFDRRLLERSKNTKRDIKFSFSGSIYSGRDAHMKRAQCIEHLLHTTDLDVYSAFANPDLKKKVSTAIKDFIVRAKGLVPGRIISPERISQWQSHPGDIVISGELLKNFKPPVFGMDMFDLLARSLVSLNVHIDIAGSYAASVRMYEITGMGACLLTDNKDDIAEYFEPDSEILTFNTPWEAEDKYKYIIKNPKKLKSMALKGQERTLKEHSMEERLIYLNQLIIDNLR